MEPLQRIINLIKKTGDKAVILDKNGHPEYVIMAVGDYENLLADYAEGWDLTGEEILDKINRDTKTWGDAKSDWEAPGEESAFISDLDQNIDDYPSADFNPIPEPPIFDDFSPNLAKFDEEEEDRYYIEPVE